ncbi:MAG: TRAP transporter large permease [Treponema sp.]|nr:TRAP transporter large permease [Treponema sp.]
MLGFPVTASILIPSAAYLLLNGFPLEMIAQRIQHTLNSYTLTAVPLFILVGNLMNRAGITSRMYHFADTAVGRVPGGLAQVNIFYSLIFAAKSGAALADIGAMGQIHIKAMKDKGFSVPYSAAVSVASAIIGPITPPSIPIILYASIAGVSVIRLLLSGIVPGLLLCAALMAVTVVLAYRRKYPRAERWSTGRELWAAFYPALPSILTPALLVFGMLSGMFTPTEAAAITVSYLLLISLFYRELTLRGIGEALLETVKSSCSVLIIVGAASLFGWILAIEQVPQTFSVFLLSISSNPLVLLAILNLILLVVGLVLDSTTATLLLVPIVIPPLVSVGIDPVHLGIVFVFNIMMGLVTPPMGLALFMISKVGNVAIKDVIKELLPYYIPLIVVLLICTYFPAIVLWIPNMIQ